MTFYELSNHSKDPDNRRQPSAARLAAEAFFSASPRTASSEPKLTVVVTHRFNNVAKDKPEVASQVESRNLEAARRGPRVFKREPRSALTSHSAEIHPPNDASDPAEGDEPSAHLLPLQKADSGKLPRKKIRQLHGEVIITRPDRIQAQSSALPAPLLESPQAPNDEVGKSLALELQAPRPRGRLMEQADKSWPQYPILMAKIRELEAVAQTMKKAETDNAIHWIRQAIATYDISAEELGFGDRSKKARR